MESGGRRLSLKRSGKWREKCVVEEKWKVEGEVCRRSGQWREKSVVEEKWTVEGEVESGGRRVSLRRSGKWREKGVVEEKWKVEGEGCR